MGGIGADLALLRAELYRKVADAGLPAGLIPPKPANELQLAPLQAVSRAPVDSCREVRMKES